LGEQRILKTARRQPAEGLSLRAISARLRADGIVPRAGRLWHTQTVSNLLNGRVAA
jgi:hypothetical protein